MKHLYKVIALLLFLPLALFSQEEAANTEKQAEVKEQIQQAAFESSFVIDNQTDHLLDKKELEFTIQHRFGLITGGINDLAGFWAPSNIRIALNYGISQRINIGYGTTKDSRLQDFNLKLSIFRQTVSNKMPVSVSYYGNMVVDARNRENFKNLQDRYSYFNQIIIARRFSDVLSLQIAPSISHINRVDASMKNDLIAIAIGGKYKLSDQTSLTFDYSQPLTKFDANQPKPGISLGAEFNTGSHFFHVFISNNKAIVPQNNYFYNQNDFFKGEFLIGFIITRLWFF